MVVSCEDDPRLVARLARMRAAYAGVVRHRWWVLLGLGGLILASVMLDFSLGPSGLTPGQLVRTVLNPSAVPVSQRIIVWQIRLPYAVMALLVGVSLGLSGAEMQTVLDNPLADPFTLGVSAAAAFGASVAIVLRWHLPFLPEGWVVSGDAFVFAVGSALALDGVARLRSSSTATVVLFGIALVFTFHALVSLVQFVADEDSLQELVFWTLGSLTRSTWPKVGVLALACGGIVPLSLRSASALTALRLGEDRAAGFGVDVRRVRVFALLRISVLAALAVSFVGTIGFVGLIAPHIARRLVGEDHRFYLPGSALVGCLVMSLSSVAARNLVHGVVVPIGIVTALVGIPFFLGIVLRARP